MRIYVASSWRNTYQPGIIKALRDTGHEVYDFRNPAPGNNGFHWKEIDPNWENWKPSEYIKALNHRVAESGFDRDFNAMLSADACVLVLPCGRSAHLEAGWFTGIGKPVWVLLDKSNEPELMYKLVDGLYTELDSLILAIQKYERKENK